jgi:hypothetical protein
MVPTNWQLLVYLTENNQSVGEVFFGEIEIWAQAFYVYVNYCLSELATAT